MGAKSTIEWTDASWTPIRARARATGKVGWHCVHASEACRFCYAERMNLRLGTGLPFKLGHVPADIELFLDEAMLLTPLRWRKPRKVFVCSMTDLFGDFVPDEWIDKVFAVMALSDRHTFQVLTKRPQRMRRYFSGIDNGDGEWLDGIGWRDALIEGTAQAIYYAQTGVDTSISLAVHMPLPNVWLGTSVEDQKTAAQGISHLVATPAARLFVSYEPALGPVDFTLWMEPCSYYCDHGEQYPEGHRPERSKLDWIIAGGESGQHARPSRPDWFRKVRDDCAAADVPFFFKQWGEHLPGGQHRADGTVATLNERPGKKRAGRLLDGVEHNGFPEAAA